MVQKRSLGEHVFDICNVVMMIALVFITVYPIWYVVVCSFSDSVRLVGCREFIWMPIGFNLGAYKAVFNNPNIFSGYRITLVVVCLGTFLNVVMTSICAFLMSRKQFAAKKFVMRLVVFTMFFSGGMIPTYLVVYNFFHLGNTIWALILPTAINTYNMIIMKSNFESLPDSVEEAAKIDGVNDIQLLIKIVLPMSKSIIAVMVLFYGVAHWNSWFPAMMYIRDKRMYPLQLVLREILLINNANGMGGNANAGEQYALAETIKYATIVVATVPILCVYPFIQKYFVQGVMIGAVKG